MRGPSSCDFLCQSVLYPGHQACSGFQSLVRVLRVVKICPLRFAGHLSGKDMQCKVVMSLTPQRCTMQADE